MVILKIEITEKLPKNAKITTKRTEKQTNIKYRNRGPVFTFRLPGGRFALLSTLSMTPLLVGVNLSKTK